MVEEYLPVVAWGYIGLVFTGLLMSFAIWGIVLAFHRRKLMPDDVNQLIGLSMILFAFSAIVFIGSMWHFGLL